MTAALQKRKNNTLPPRLLPGRRRGTSTSRSLDVLSCLLLGDLRGLLGCLLCLRLLLCSQKRRILMWAIHWLLRNRSRRRIHGCLLLALHDHAAQMLRRQLPDRFGWKVGVLGPVVHF